MPCRLEFASVVQFEADGPQSFIVVVNKVTKMKPNMADVPYTVEKNSSSSWSFTLSYVKVDSFMPLAQEQLVISRLPAQDRWERNGCRGFPPHPASYHVPYSVGATCAVGCEVLGTCYSAVATHARYNRHTSHSQCMLSCFTLETSISVIMVNSYWSCIALPGVSLQHFA